MNNVTPIRQTESAKETVATAPTTGRLARALADIRQANKAVVSARTR